MFENSANLCIQWHFIAVNVPAKKTANEYERIGRWTNQINATSACVFSNICLKLKYCIVASVRRVFIRLCAYMSDFFLFFSRSVEKNRMHGRRTTVSLGAREKWFFLAERRKHSILNVIQSKVYALIILVPSLSVAWITMLYDKGEWTFLLFQVASSDFVPIMYLYLLVDFISWNTLSRE